MLQIGYDRTAANGAGLHFDMHPSVLLDQHFYLQPTAEVDDRDLPDPDADPARGP